MKKIKKHKIFIVSFLLMMYTFIAVPTQFWHSHVSQINKADIAQEYQQKEVKASFKINNIDEADCEICSHHYANFINDAAVFHFEQLTFFYKNVSLIQCNIVKATIIQFSDRAPPALS